MEWPDLEGAIHNWGWIGVLLFFLMREVWPQTFKWWSVSKQTELDAKLDTMRAQQQRNAEDAEDERKVRQTEREFRHSIDERQVKSYEQLVAAIEAMKVLMVQITERLNIMYSDQQSHNLYLIESVALMRERVARRSNPKPKEEPK